MDFEYYATIFFIAAAVAVMAFSFGVSVGKRMKTE